MADLWRESVDRVCARTVRGQAQVLTALNTAEAVRTKLLTVGGLKQRIINRDLENAVRDYISQHPWLVSHEWGTFAVENSVNNLLVKARDDSGITSDPEFHGRVDLALASGDQLLVLEFMRPGLTLDWDHANRFERYVRIVKSDLRANTAGRFSRATGYIVANRLTKRADLMDKLLAMENDQMLALDWSMLLSRAASQWEEFLSIVAGRDPQDERLQALVRDEYGQV